MMSGAEHVPAVAPTASGPGNTAASSTIATNRIRNGSPSAASAIQFFLTARKGPEKGSSSKKAGVAPEHAGESSGRRWGRGVGNQ